MLAELAAANAAFAIIKSAVQNGSDIAKAGKAISDFTNAKDSIRKQASKHGSNLDGSKSDLEEFLALEEVKKKEDELRSMMQLYGRAGMYDDYIRFCAEARKAREEAKRQAKLRRQQLEHNIAVWATFIAVSMLGVLGLGLIVRVLMGANNV